VAEEVAEEVEVVDRPLLFLQEQEALEQEQPELVLRLEQEQPELVLRLEQEQPELVLRLEQEQPAHEVLDIHVESVWS
jgi:hypothetical protein